MIWQTIEWWELASQYLDWNQPVTCLSFCQLHHGLIEKSGHQCKQYKASIDNILSILDYEDKFYCGCQNVYVTHQCQYHHNVKCHQQQSFSIERLLRLLGLYHLLQYSLSLIIRLRAGGGAAPALNSRYKPARKTPMQLSSDSEEDMSFSKWLLIQQGCKGVMSSDTVKAQNWKLWRAHVPCRRGDKAVSWFWPVPSLWNVSDPF